MSKYHVLRSEHALAVCTIHSVGYERAKNGVSMLINPPKFNHPTITDCQILVCVTLNGAYLLLKLLVIL